MFSLASLSELKVFATRFGSGLRTIYLELTHKAFQNLSRGFPRKSKDDICREILNDLNDACGVTQFNSKIPLALQSSFRSTARPSGTTLHFTLLIMLSSPF